MNAIDSFLNKITMYRLVLYGLIVMLSVAVVLSAIHILPFSPVNLIFSTLFLVFFCGFVNEIFSHVFEAPVNCESAYITALILALILLPARSLNGYVFLAWVAILAMASKYIFAFDKKHIFNPAAVAVFLTGTFANRPADWWVGTLAMVPVVTAVGLLIVRKTRREDMVFALFCVVVATALVLSAGGISGAASTLEKLFMSSSLLFFAFVMFTEPLTMPPTTGLQLGFAALVGVLFVPQTHLGSLYFTPEMALLAGNVFAYFVSPKDKLIFKVEKKIKTAPDTYDFVFPLKKKLAFRPGQYMEWTLPHNHVDGRGNRRYFTIASSPTEDTVRLGIKFYEPASSFKRALLDGTGRLIVGSQQAGSFTLPKDTEKKLVFLAGGIGVTPYRSMLKYLIDTGEKRDITVFYSNRRPEEVVYRDVLDEAANKIGIRVIYTLTDKDHVPAHWKGETGRVNSEMIKKHVPDYEERIYFLSGPHVMVSGFETVLKQMGVNQIKTDFFPGFV